jgi:parallel beta-helix repeat protein
VPVSALVVLALVLLGGTLAALLTPPSPPPAVAIVVPDDDSGLNGVVSVEVETSDGGPVDRVRWFIDGELHAEHGTREAGSSLTWDTTTFLDGSYGVRVEAYDRAGRRAVDTRTLEVENAVSIPPARHIPRGRVFHVDPEAGEDGLAVPGTEEAPFRTVGYAGERAHRPGDTIYLRGGTYREPVAAGGVRGEPGAPIVISSYPDERAVFDGTDVPLDPGRSLFHVYESSHVIVQNITVQHSTQSGMTAEGEHIVLRNNHVHDAATHLMQGRGDHIRLERNDLHQGAMANEDNAAEVHGGGLGSTNTVDDDLLGRRSTDVAYIDNTVHEVWGECIAVFHVSGAEVRGNRVYNCRAAGIYLDNAEEVVVEGNHVYRTSDAWAFNESLERPEGHAKGILLGTEHYHWMPPDRLEPPRDVLIANNIVTGYAAGLSWWPHDVLMRECPRCPHRYSDVRVRHNVFTGNDDAVRVYPVPPGERRPTGVVATNNVFDGPVNVLGGDDRAWTFRNNAFPSGRTAGAGALTDPPGFVGGEDVHDPGRFRLGPTSPLIRRGAPTAETRTDFWGRPRPDPPSIGVHEP